MLLQFPSLTRSLAALALCAGLPLTCLGQEEFYEQEPHRYFSTPVADPATQLFKELREGQKKLDRSSELNFVRSLLKLLHIHESSQVLLFSKTSLQRDKISPWNARALYYNEECYVGWVPGGLVEVACMDPRLGPIFYSLDPHAKEDPPPLDRSENCLSCHASGMTGNLPGLMIRSVFTDKSGFPLLQAGTTLVDHTTPLQDRWGGWYVTGTHGTMRHMGNALAEELDKNEVKLDREKGANVKSLEQFLQIDRYPSRGSDIVSLMVLEHQVMAHTRLTEAAYHVRSAIARMQALQKDFGDPVTDVLSGSALSVAQSYAEKILKCFLFVDEAPLPEGGIEGDPKFQEDYRANRLKAASGKSLKDFQLLTRIFKYRCSPLIHGKAYAALPQQLKEILKQRFTDILTAKEAPKDYAHLTDSERAVIWEILTETKALEI